MSNSNATNLDSTRQTITLTAEQAQLWSMNTENKWAWWIASGLSGWMQMLCAKSIGNHVREDPARMVLVEILQAQRGDLRLAINARPPGWENANERADVCLGRERTPGSAGVIELKWPWTVEKGDRIKARIDMAQDIARLASVRTTEAPHLRYFVLGLMKQAGELLLGKRHTQNVDREAQRTTFANLLSNDPSDRERTVTIDELEKIFSELQNRTPELCRLKGCAIKTRLMAAQELLVGNTGLGWVYVWQCDCVDLPKPLPQTTRDGALANPEAK